MSSCRSRTPTARTTLDQGRLAALAVAFTIAILFTFCAEGELPELREEQDETQPAPAFSPQAELLAGTVWSCGAYSTDDRTPTVLNILELRDEDALYLAADVGARLIPERDVRRWSGCDH